MEKYRIWLLLSFRQQIKKKSYIVLLLLFALVLQLLVSLKLPSADNVQIGYCYDRESADWFGDLVMNDTLEFVQYPDEDALDHAVMTGEADCGFVLPQTLRAGARITSVTSAYSTKDAAARLMVFAQAYRLLSPEVLKEADSEIFGNADGKRAQELIKKNREFLEGGDVFQVEVTHLQAEPQKQTGRAGMLQTVGGVFVLLFMLLAGVIVYDDEKYQLLLALHSPRRLCCLYLLAAGCVPAVLLYVTAVTSASSRGVWTEGISLVLCIALALIWSLVLVNRRLPQDLFYAFVITWLLVQFLLCNPLIDLAVYVPVIRGLRWIFPLGIYTML